MRKGICAARRGDVTITWVRDAAPRMAETRVVCVPRAITRSVPSAVWAINAIMTALVR